ncbi:hypothetical protein [Streptomyces sp. bgisy159]|uniref:hypothetical protein n=1 Tax=Streptomyces sp. bgisy159 TaxID=3413795 RepID=UPI003F4A199C
MPAVPDGISTVVLSGRFVRPDGTPLAGTITFEPPAALTYSSADVISVGSAVAELDADGAFAIVLMATDDPGVDPTGWTYTVVERLARATGRTYHLALPAATPAVDLADIAPTDPAGGEYVVVTGPAGADGSQIISGTGAPDSATGADGDYYIDTTPGAVTWYGPKAGGAWPAGTVLTGSGSAPVTSVNSQTGDVVLAAADVGAAATDDTRLSDARTPTGAAGGDLGGTYPNPQVTATNLSAPLPVAQGGTGASSASAALTALGGVASTEKGVASGVATLGTDGRLTIGQSPTRSVVKPSDTPRDTTTTPAADPALTLTVVANATYDVELLGVWTSGGGGLKATWSVPSGATMVWTDNDGVGVASASGSVTFNATTGTMFKGTLVVGANAGSITFLWSQNSSNASPTTLKAGSSLKLTRLS